MDKHTPKEIEHLQGLPLQIIGRAAGMLWMQFGSVREIADRKGNPKPVGDWALHVDTTWRIIRGDRILFGHSDMNFNAGDNEPYDWDIGGKNRFDEKADALNLFLQDSKTVVQGIACDGMGGLKLDFQGDIVFEIFPTISSDFLDYELWRLFEPRRDTQHFVAEASGFVAV